MREDGDDDDDDEFKGCLDLMCWFLNWLMNDDDDGCVGPKESVIEMFKN